VNRRERLTTTLRGQPVDRPAVCFYEINGLDQDENDPDPFNIYSHPSWKPLLELTRERTECVPRRKIGFLDAPPDPLAELTDVETWTDAAGSRFTRRRVRAGKRTLTSLTRRDPDVDTVWTLEHLVKDEEDFLAWLELPAREPGGEVDVAPVLAAERRLGDAGIVMIDRADPLCRVAALFPMSEFTVVALTRPDLMHRALEKVQAERLPETRAAAEALPGRLWRIVGPEYASPPYLPPELFREYVTRYDTPMVEAVQARGGFARIHSHGRLREVLDHIAATGCTGLDPIEPPHQGDVSLAYVRERYGRQMTLWGNIEASDLENLPAELFREKVRTALEEGTAGEGRGFVLMPSACPYGRELSPRTVGNYEIMVELTEGFF
jgi:hypothetical protein